MEMTKEKVLKLLTKELGAEQAQEIVNNESYCVWDFLDDMIEHTLDSTGVQLPKWVQIDAFGTWENSLRYWDYPPIFLDLTKEMPKAYGNDRDEYIRIMKHACEHSRVLEYWF